MAGKAERQRQIRTRVTTFIVAVAALIAAISLYIKFAPSKERMDLAVYYSGLVQEARAIDTSEAGENTTTADEERKSEVTLDESRLAVIMQDHAEKRRALYSDESLYLNYDMVREELNDRFFWDAENEQMLYTTALETYEIPLGSNTYTIDGTEKSFDRKILIKDESGTLYINADYAQLYTNFEFVLKTEENHVLLNYVWGDRTKADVKKKTQIRYTGGIKSPILADAAKGDTVYVLEQLDKWSKVVTADGVIGYIQNKKITKPEVITVSRDFEEEEYPSLVRDHKINLAWHMVDNTDMNPFFDDATKDMKGVNVISPTWFALSDNEGNFISRADKDYVTKAHKKGLEVWALIDNFSPDMSTKTLVASTKARRTLAQNLIDAAKEYDLDGINIDFETIAQSAGYGFVQFMREFSILCRKNNIVLSVDIPVAFEFNKHYNRKELATVCDYVIQMGYDEHYYGSDAGTVASLSFEENGIKAMLEDGVDPKKIISGVPFYTRLWYTSEDPSAITDSTTLSMNAVKNTIESYKAEPVWDEETQQNYVTWTLDDGLICQIWIEDAKSLQIKAGLVHTYDLGGIAEWALTFETPDIWDALTAGMEGKSVEEVQKETEALTEAATEKVTEAKTEVQTEAQTKVQTEKQTETVPEKATEKESTVQKDKETDAQTESETKEKPKG